MGTNRIEVRSVQKTGRMGPSPTAVEADGPYVEGRLVEEFAEVVPRRYNTYSELEREVAPGVNQFDLRFAKILRFGRTRTNVGLDVYNITNSAPVLSYNQTFILTTDSWLRPNSVLQARFVKVSAQIDF